jgi:hypothetical protein
VVESNNNEEVYEDDFDFSNKTSQSTGPQTYTV